MPQVFIQFIHEFAVLEQDRNSKSWLVLIITDIISERAQSTPLQRRMINMQTGKLHLFNDDDINSDKMLTDRGIEVLMLISQGLDSQNIASKLFISVKTVNNHRQKILRKTKTENTTQALLYAKWIGII